MEIQSCYLNTDGVKAHYLEAGQGPPLLLVASPLVRAQTYKPTIRYLSKHFRVLALELPGSGWSGALQEPWDLGRYARWCLQFLDAMQLEQVVVVGHSNSAAVALHAGTGPSRRPAGIVLVDSIGARSTRSVLELLAGRAMDAALEITLTLRGWPDILFNCLYHTHSFLRQIRVAVTADVTRTARSVEVPVLLAWGRRDRTVPIKDARRLERCLPDCQIHISSGSHDWLMLRPKEFAETVTRFYEARLVLNISH